MSKDIWRFPSEAPAYCFLCVFENSFDGEVHCGHYNPVKKQFCSTEGRYEINQVKKYCDLLHLLDCEQELIRIQELLEIECAEHSMCHTQMLKTTEKLERTRKALDIAINVLNRVKDVKYEEYIDEKLEQINEIIKGGNNE